MTRTRDEIEQDLVFHVNGTVDDATRAEIDAWLNEDALLAAERDALSVIREEMQAEEIRSPGEFGLARLMRDVERSAPVARPSANRSWMWQAVAAVAVVGLLAQTFMLRDEAQTGSFELAGSGAAAGALVVAFAPDAREADIRALLMDNELEIVGGPSALGLYRLDVLEGADLNAAVANLEAASGVVESVENAVD